MLKLFLYIILFLGTLLFFFIKYLFKFIFVGLNTKDGEEMMSQLIINMELTPENIFYKANQKKKI